MKAIASIDRTEITHNPAVKLYYRGNINSLQDTEAQAPGNQATAHQGKPDSKLRAAARPTA